MCRVEFSGLLKEIKMSIKDASNYIFHYRLIKVFHKQNYPSVLIYTLLVWFCISGSSLLAGTTGKITGIVRDASTEEPLIGANIIIEGTSIGAATDIEGRYIILNIPPGVYEVKSMMIGYTSARTVGIKISIDVTTTLHFQLQPSVLDFEEVTITAERKIIRKDLTSTLSIVGSDEIAEMPVEEFEDILALQAGVIVGSGGEIHIRGGAIQ